ncbi:hypothetical protein HK102_005293, partial [Quaeritorhiza haematococci]
VTMMVVTTPVLHKRLGPFLLLALITAFTEAIPPQQPLPVPLDSANLAGPVHAEHSGITYRLGEAFVVRLRGREGAPSFEVADVENGEVVLKTPSNHPFICSSNGHTNLTTSSGNFEITSTATSTPTQCHSPSLSNISSPNSRTLRLTGGFSDSTSGCSETTWTVEIEANPALKGGRGREEGVSSDGIRIVARVEGSRGVRDNVGVSFESPVEEAFFGLGEQPGWGDLRGLRIPIFTREGGVGRGASPVTEYLNSNPSVGGTFSGGSKLTTYTGIGSFVTSLGRWCIIRGSNFALVDLASGRDEVPFEDTAAGQVRNSGRGDEAYRNSDSNTTAVTITYEGSSLELDFGRAGSKLSPPLLEAVTSLTKVTGKQPRLPEWVHDGAVLGIQGGQEKVEWIIREAQSYDMPVAAVWLQDWCGTRLQAGLYNISLSRLWWNWENDKALYPTWSDWVPHLRSTYNVRTLSYINTFLANVSNKRTGFTTNFYEEAKATGRFVMNATTFKSGSPQPWTVTSGPGIDAGLLDISNQTTVEWFKDLVKRQFYSVPISGAMQDFGEYLATDETVSISSGLISPRAFHNEYPTAWAKLLREVVEELSLHDEVVGFHRSASTFSTPYQNLFWVGDQNIDATREDGLPSAISSAIHVGFSGFGVSHSDVGGYTNTLTPTFNITRSPALLGRWGEVSAFSGAIFRTHEGNIPSVNAQFYSNASTYIYHAYNVRMFRSLRGYRRALLEEYYRFGWPLVRHPLLYAPIDLTDEDVVSREETAWARSIIDECFWFGDSIYVWPDYDPLLNGTTTVLLPRGQAVSSRRHGEAAREEEPIDYLHLWSNQTYSIPRRQWSVNVTVDSPYGQIPVFLRLPLSGERKEQLKGLFEFVEREKGTVLPVDFA